MAGSTARRSVPMLPRDDAAWAAQRAVLRALVFDAAQDRANSSWVATGPAFLVRTDMGQVDRQLVGLVAHSIADYPLRLRKGQGVDGAHARISLGARRANDCSSAEANNATSSPCCRAVNSPKRRP